MSLRADHDFGALTLTSISAYRRISFDQAFDADFTNRALVDETYNQSDEQISQEFQIAPSHKGRLTWVAGVYYFHLSGEYDPLRLVSGAPPATTRTENFVSSPGSTASPMPTAPGRSASASRRDRAPKPIRPAAGAKNGLNSPAR